MSAAIIDLKNNIQFQINSGGDRERLGRMLMRQLENVESEIEELKSDISYLEQELRLRPPAPMAK